MTHRILLIALFLSLALNMVLGHTLLNRIDRGTTEEALSSTATSTLTGGVAYPLLRVVDGDTIILGIGTDSEYVRFIGIDTPEPNESGGPECYAREATQHLRTLVQSSGTIILHFDTTQGMRDKYGRLLAYAETTEGVDLGERMILDGYAHELTYDLPYERQGRYQQAEAAAVREARGLWSDEACADNSKAATEDTR